MIHDMIIDHVEDALVKNLIDLIPQEDPTRAGVVTRGPLQGDPDPDVARISITIYENDPDVFFGKGGSTGMGDKWDDEVDEIEVGGSITHLRRFTIKARCLLVNTGEDKTTARKIASTVRSRIERTLLNLSFAGVQDEDEYVSRGAWAESLKGEMIQAGGPPDSYDYHIKVRFDVKTTQGVTP